MNTIRKNDEFFILKFSIFVCRLLMFQSFILDLILLNFKNIILACFITNQPYLRHKYSVLNKNIILKFFISQTKILLSLYKNTQARSKGRDDKSGVSLQKYNNLKILDKMNPSQIRDLMEVTTNLQNSFRHIRLLCAKYLQVQNSHNPYLSSYDEFSQIPSQFISTPNFSANTYSNNYGFNPQIQPNGIYGINSVKQHFNQKITQPNIARNTIQTIKSKKQENASLQKTNQIKKSQNSANGKDQQKIIQKINGPVSNASKKVIQSGYDIFFLKKKDQIKKQYPHVGEAQLGQIMAHVWATFNEKQREPWQLEYKKIKSSFIAKSFNNVNRQKPNTIEIAKSIKKQLIK